MYHINSLKKYNDRQENTSVAVSIAIENVNEELDT